MNLALAFLNLKCSRLGTNKLTFSILLFHHFLFLAEAAAAEENHEADEDDGGRRRAHDHCPLVPG